MAICYHASASEIIGGICGGMTSEPDLAVAVEALESVEVAIGYGEHSSFAISYKLYQKLDDVV